MSEPTTLGETLGETPDLEALLARVETLEQFEEVIGERYFDIEVGDAKRDAMVTMMARIVLRDIGRNEEGEYMFIDELFDKIIPRLVDDSSGDEALLDAVIAKSLEMMAASLDERREVGGRSVFELLDIYDGDPDEELKGKLLQVVANQLERKCLIDCENGLYKAENTLHPSSERMREVALQVVIKSLSVWLNEAMVGGGMDFGEVKNFLQKYGLSDESGVKDVVFKFAKDYLRMGGDFNKALSLLKAFGLEIDKDMMLAVVASIVSVIRSVSNEYAKTAETDPGAVVEKVCLKISRSLKGL